MRGLEGVKCGGMNLPMLLPALSFGEGTVASQVG